MRVPVHLFTDADNTLWDTNSVYAQAQLELLRDIERETGCRAPPAKDGGLAFLRLIDQRIAVDHPDRLRYPPRLLVHGITLALAGESATRAASQALAAADGVSAKNEELAKRFVQRLHMLPPLREGVRAALQALSNAHVPVTIVTEERRDRCSRLVDAHSIAPLIGAILSVEKAQPTFERLRREADASRVAMVGDQPDRDLRPAAMAGFETYFFPGGFTPYWNEGTHGSPFVRISRYDEILSYIIIQGTNLPVPK
ncbi:HAD hydrolase-like protein [Inquilinus limosus]|uniref:HAD family hydrolase n=1 Tax=Inquilinus limosus TaxID=171674 RepID=UPI003F158725